MTVEELAQKIEALRAEYADLGQPARSGFINPSDADLAGEEAARATYQEVAQALARLLVEIPPAVWLAKV